MIDYTGEGGYNENMARRQRNREAFLKAHYPEASATTDEKLAGMRRVIGLMFDWREEDRDRLELLETRQKSIMGSVGKFTKGNWERMALAAGALYLFGDKTNLLPL